MIDWQSKSGVLLDLDGVIYRSGEALPGAQRFFRALAQRGLGCCAVTNNARATPEAYERKLAGLGIELPAERIITAGSATAAWLAHHGHQEYALLGSEALRECLREAGLHERDGAEILVIGIDADLGYRDLAWAVSQLLRPGISGVATNADRLIPVAGGYEPECGAIIAFLEYATGRRITTLGKPNPWIFRLGLARLGLAAEDVVMVGDTVDTDIAGGCATGMPTLLLESGSPIPEDRRNEADQRLSGIDALAAALESCPTNPH